MNGENMQFYEWLKKQTHRNEPIGDLAQDSINDNDAAKVQNTLIAWKNYLKSKNACNAAIESLEEAWKEYSAV